MKRAVPGCIGGVRCGWVGHCDSTCMVGGVAHTEEHLALATKFRDAGCVPEIMPAVVTLERDFLWDGVLSQAAWALLEGKHVQSTYSHASQKSTGSSCRFTLDIQYWRALKSKIERH